MGNTTSQPTAKVARLSRMLCTPPPTPPAPTDHITIKLIHNHNGNERTEIHFKIRRNRRLEKVFDYFCQRIGRERGDMKFFRLCAVVTEDDTPESVSFLR